MLSFVAVTTTIAVPTLLLIGLIQQASADCLANEEFNNFFVELNGGDSIPLPGSCCMQDVCGLACPVEIPEPSNGYTIAAIIFITISFLIGMSTYYCVKGQSVNFFVAGRSLPMWMVAVTLSMSSIDSNALLGNADLSYKFSFYDGAVIPIGLGLSLLLNGVFLAHHVNNDNVLTLPDILAKRYGKTVEVLVSLACTCSFIMLLAGNLVGFGAITSYLWGISESGAIWLAALIIWMYTIMGGLYSVAYTDAFQGTIGFTGCIVVVFWLIANESPNAPPPSIGFPGYIYPDGVGDGGICDMYNGTACVENASLCCYNTEQWCPGYPNATLCERYDRGAYPFGDKRVYSDQMSYFNALNPFPNAILWNWATIFILGIGNLGALDFQARCMASKTPRGARIGCIIAGCCTFLIGIPYAYTGGISRVYYGPDSTNGAFETDSCAIQLGLPTCALWLPDNSAFIKLLTHQAPPFLGGWCIVGILAASMSTANGAILALGTVFSHNIIRQFDAWSPNLVTPSNLLLGARLATVPMTVAASCIAAFYRSSNAAGATGYLLIVAFDIVFATIVVPLFGCFYAKNPSPRAALLAVLSGTVTRVVLEFALPKDGFLILPYDEPSFLIVGPAASTLYPAFIDVPATDIWDPASEVCQQEPYEDYTGVDSIAGFLCCLIVFLSVQAIENARGVPLFSFFGDVPYEKDYGDTGDSSDAKFDADETRKGPDVFDSSDEGDVNVKVVEAEAVSE